MRPKRTAVGTAGLEGTGRPPQRDGERWWHCRVPPPPPAPQTPSRKRAQNGVGAAPGAPRPEECTALGGSQPYRSVPVLLGGGRHSQGRDPGPRKGSRPCGGVPTLGWGGGGPSPGRGGGSHVCRECQPMEGGHSSRGVPTLTRVPGMGGSTPGSVPAPRGGPGSPSRDMPTSRHFLKRHCWQRLRLMRTMEQFSFFRHFLYWMFCWMLRRKNPCGAPGGHWRSPPPHLLPPRPQPVPCSPRRRAHRSGSQRRRHRRPCRAAPCRSALGGHRGVSAARGRGGVPPHRPLPSHSLVTLVPFLLGEPRRRSSAATATAPGNAAEGP